MNPSIFCFYNLLPTEVSAPARFLLCLMAFSCPLEERAVYRILKTVVCDDNAPAVLKSLLGGGYIVQRQTGQGTFYGLTAKALGYLDYEKEHLPHRAATIPDKLLTTYRMRGLVIAEAVVHVAAMLWRCAWDSQTDAWKNAYLSGSRLTAIPDTLDTALIDMLPRQLVTPARVAKAVSEAIEGGRIPFTAPYNGRVYVAIKSNLLHLLHAHDAAQRHKMKLNARRKAPGKHPSQEQAQRYNDLTRQIEAVDKSIEELTRKAAMLTYGHGLKVLSLSVLDLNGIFVEHVTDKAISLGILNDAPYGLPAPQLARRLDFCVTLADHLGVTASVTVYTLPSAKRLTERSLDLALRKLGAAFPVPPIQWHELPSGRPVLKYMSKQQHRESVAV